MIIWILGSTFKLLYIRTTATYFSCTRATTNYYCVLLLLLTTTTTTVPVRTTTLENFGEWVRMGWPAAPSWRLPLWQHDVVDIAIIIMLVGARWWWRWRQILVVTEAIVVMEWRVLPFSSILQSSPKPSPSSLASSCCCCCCDLPVIIAITILLIVARWWRRWWECFILTKVSIVVMERRAVAIVKLTFCFAKCMPMKCRSFPGCAFRLLRVLVLTVRVLVQYCTSTYDSRHLYSTVRALLRI